MKRVIPLILVGALTMSSLSVLSAPIGAYDQVMQAVYARDKATLKYLVSVGLNINATNLQGKTALCTAVENQDYEGYELLLSEGATTRTPCMRYMDPEILNRFLADQPALGTYYKGAVLTASRNGAVTGIGKDAATTIGSLPYPHIGEFVLAGIAVGTALAIGAHGSSGGDSSSNYSSPFDNEDKTASNYLNHEYFSKPTSKTLSSTQKGGIPGATEELASLYGTEYAGGSWKDAWGDPVDNINFLNVINADYAYARGYSGAVVNRDSSGLPVGKGWDAVSDNKVKVAVMDCGLFYHTDFASNLYKDWIPGDSTDTYKQSIGLNYEYGVKSAANTKSYYWEYGTWDVKGVEVTGAALFYKGEPAWPTVFQLEKSAWYKYAGRFAPACTSGKTDVDGNCLKVSNDISNVYTVEYVSGYNPENPGSETVLATYYTFAALWDEYVAKYGSTGYVYDPTNATPNFFDDSSDEDEISFGHGTHVAGIIGALRNGVGMQGVAYNADILPVKIDFNRSYEILSNIASVAKQAKIINLSIGPSATAIGASNFVSNNLTETKTYWNNLLSYLDYGKTYSETAKNGAIQVFAAGNNGKAQPSIHTAAPLVDESFKNLVISVVALGDPSEATYHKDTGDITFYSNRCGATASYCLSAPGGGVDEDGYITPIASTGIQSDNITSAYIPSVGTSLAAPIVSGSLAVLMGAFPFLTSQQAVQILLKTATYIEPDKKEITAYNTLAGSATAYQVNTVAGEYNAIYGHGLVNLNAATDPVGLPKITFDSSASSEKAELVANSSAHVSPVMGNAMKALPENLIVLDDYTRAYVFPLKFLIQKEGRQDGLRRSFRSFMAQNEKEISVSDTVSFAFSKAATDKKNSRTGAMSMVMRPNKNVQMRLGFTEDTASFGGSYVGRSLQNPFMNMRQVFGAQTSVQFARNWALTGEWYTGKNGFVDEDVFDKMDKQPRMRLMESGITYQGIKNVTLGVSGGVMKEEDSLFGTRGTGAFRTDGAETRFVRVVANYQPNDKFRLGASYTYGMTNAQKKVSLMSVSRLTSDSFAVTAEYQPNEKQTFGLKFVSPLRIRSGSARFDLPVARDMYEDTIYRENYVVGLKPQAREYDLSVFYANEISSDLSWAGETGVRLNPDHQKNVSPDYRALFKLNWTW